MKEKMKTFFLFFLVGLCIFFTKELIMDLSVENTPIGRRRGRALSASYNLIDMIAPNKYILHFSDKNHTLFYDDSKYGLWTNTRESLKNILSSKHVEVVTMTNEEFMDYSNKRSIVYDFPEKVSTYILAKALNIKDPNEIVETMPEMYSIYLYLDKGEPFFIFSNKEEHIALYDPTIDVKELKNQFISIESEKQYNFFHSMRETMGTNNDVYIPYEMKNNPPTVYVENEIRTMSYERQVDLVETFFNKDIDYIREIVENNGSTIYVYNQKVLKLNINGTLEYFNPLEDIFVESNLYESMTTAANFISNTSGVPKGMYLAKSEEIQQDGSSGYKLTFKYRIKGMPVILGNRESVDFIEVEVFNSHIRSYKHFIRKEMNIPIEDMVTEKGIPSSFNIIDMNYGFLESEYIKYRGFSMESQGQILAEEVLSNIVDITLAYYDPCLKDVKDELYVVWVVKTKDNSYAFDAYEGFLIYEKDLG